MLDSLTYGFFMPLFLYFSNTATPVTFPDQNGKYNEVFTINSLAEYQSSSVNSSFFFQALTGKFLDTDIKNSVSNRLASTNRIALDWNTELTYLKMGDSLFGGKNWGYFIGFKNRLWAGSGFRDAVFNLGFYGNAPYAGQPLDLSNTWGNLMMYQQIGFGLVKQFPDKKVKHTLGGGVYFVNGNFNIDFTSRNMTFYTDTFGQYVDVEADFRFRQTNPDNFTPFFPTGQGVSFDLFYEIRFGKGNALFMQANDLGFISWNDFSRTITVDTAVRFDGVTINDIFSIDDATISDIGDSLSSLFNAKTDSGRYMVPLPMSFHIAYAHPLASGKVWLYGGVRHYLLRNWIPQMYARVAYYPAQWFMLGGQVAYGGPGGLQVGLDLGFNFGKGYLLNICTRNLESIVPNTMATGTSVGLRFAKHF